MKKIIFIILFICSLGTPSLSFANLNSDIVKGAKIQDAEYYIKKFKAKPKFGLITISMLDKLNKLHYKKIKIHNAFSRQLFKNYLEILDPQKNIFSEEDIKNLSFMKDILDDTLQEGNVNAAFLIYNLYNAKMIKRLTSLIHNLDKTINSFDFSKKESIVIDQDNKNWAKDNKQLDDIWRKHIKNAVLEMILKDEKDKKIIKKTLEDRYRYKLSTAIQVKDEDIFQLYMLALTKIYDPHTQYFPPKIVEDFNMNMSLSLEGIGAMLQTSNQYVKVTKLIPGGPAAKGKRLSVGDLIVGVGQDKKGEIVDVVGWRIDDVVSLIRGPKKTTVRLAIIPKGSVDEKKTKIISIVRDTVELKEQAAHKEIKQSGKNKIGIIKIPTFYRDFTKSGNANKNFRSTTVDVKKLIEELQKEKIQGLIIDLRGNGGGSLQEANDTAGLFIEKGPIVQVKDTNLKITKYYDEDKAIIYNGPLIVLINRLSASASEIFAGAIQDYKRGVIVGNQSFGKGTVQELRSLAEGELKLTRSKFYRISGQSTQLKGVIPDIKYPSFINTEEIGESSLDEALAWDTINACKFKTYQSPKRINSIIKKLVKKHEKRIQKNPDFIAIEDLLKIIDKNREKKEISLNMKIRKKELENNKSKKLKIENKKRTKKGLKPFKTYKELEENTNDDDLILDETVNIMNDYINLNKSR